MQDGFLTGRFKIFEKAYVFMWILYSCRTRNKEINISSGLLLSFMFVEQELLTEKNSHNKHT